MSSRATGEPSGGVLSFTFLDVLTCTMGTLVLLLVVLGERAKRTAVAAAAAEVAAASLLSAPPPGSHHPPLTAEQAEAQMATWRTRQAELDALRAEAAERLREEQLRVSHLEDHERRLEHELAKLHFTLERLDETEKEQRVDQETAERSLERLTALVSEAEERIAEAQNQPAQQRSYAIVPYKGANGTYRRPIYVECTKEAVIIQPEGIRLNAVDFDGPLRSGNPLAAAVRAAREELAARAKASGGVDSSAPYPLLVVRPDGAAAYAVALSALGASDAEYGYEFVDADWDLEFPAVDPRLGQVMAHAVEQARARQALLAKAAPRRYGSRLRRGGAGAGGGAGMGAGRGDGLGDGFGEITHNGGGGDRIGQRTGDGDLTGIGAGAGRGGRLDVASSDGRGSAGGDFADQFASQPGAAERSDQMASTGEAPNSSETEGGPSPGAPGGGPAGQAAQPSGLATAGAGYSSTANNSTASSGGGSPAPDVHAAETMTPVNAAAGAAAGAAASDSGAAAGMAASRQRGSAAAERGANWANAAASEKSSAITRPIKVIVGPNEICLLPEGSADPADATVVTFHQPTNRLMDQLADSVQQQIKEWGLAGRAMYWRPTLVLQVAPGAQRQAARLTELLEDSGIDVRMPQTAVRPAEGAIYER